MNEMIQILLVKEMVFSCKDTKKKVTAKHFVLKIYIKI